MIDEKVLIRSILPYVERPAQYVGGELNSVEKDWHAAPCRMAFAFPDSYEIGMSHLGLRLLYEAINHNSPHLLERVFMPLPDMAERLRKLGLPLFTLESRHGLAEFDVLGFTLQYELSYTNILAMLDLAGIPLLAAERGEDMPLVIAGGPCAYHPEPLAEVIDLFVIGEGEEMDIELLDLVAEAKAAGWNREELLRHAVALPGVYVPRFYQPTYRNGHFDGLSLTADAPAETPLRVMKRVVSDFETSAFPARPILPNIKPVHDRVMLEVMRGCTHGCRFCQAGAIYRPLRERSRQRLQQQAAAQLAASGYDDVALLSLSTADYSCVEGLMGDLLDAYAAQGVGVSLPSLRVDAFSVALAARTQSVRKSGITLAPEAGSARLRDTINKGVTEQDILSAATAAFSQGYSHIKLYFMIGLPYETDSDILAIAELCRKILQLGRQHKPAEVKKPLRLSLGVSSFVPKSHTPFQWQGQNSTAVLKHKQDLLREQIRPLRQVTVNFHDCASSLLEAAFARGDRRLNRVLLEAYRRGCMLDGWNEHFHPEAWREAFAACGLSAEQFAEREIVYGEPLPWAHIDCGVKTEWLWREYIRAGRAELTADCRGGECSGCGVCRDGRVNQIQEKGAPAAWHGQVAPPAAGADGQTYRYRCRLAIRGRMVWLSHLDLLAAVEKAIRRAELPIAFSQGFNPHMQISWGPAHPVGLGGESEYFDLLFHRQPAADWQSRFNATLPPGLTLCESRQIPAALPALMAAINYVQYRVELPEVDPLALDAAVAAFLAAKSVVVERVSPKGKKTVDLRPAVEKLWQEDGVLHAGIRLDRGATPRMQEIITQLAPGAAAQIVRSGLYLAEDGTLRNP